VKVTEIPLGNPVTEKVTGALKPSLTVTVRVMLLFDSAVREREFAEAVAWNTGVAVASRQWLTRVKASIEPRPVA
jgi:hypothetical protein